MRSSLFNIARISNSQFKCNYLKNEKLFLNFLVHFWNLHQILNILKKKVMVIANVFPNFETVENFVTPLYKKWNFGSRLESWHVKVSWILAKSSWEHFYHFSSSFWGKFVWKISLLVLGEIKGAFVNTLAADGKYLVQYCKNLQSPIQLQLSEKRKTFPEFFVPFLESTSNFQHFENKDAAHS